MKNNRVVFKYGKYYPQRRVLLFWVDYKEESPLYVTVSIFFDTLAFAKKFCNREKVRPRGKTIVWKG